LLNYKKRIMNKFRVNEFIGLKVEIIDSTNHLYSGLKGKVIDESYNMLIISIKNKIKAIPKKDCIFKFKPKQKSEIEIAGSNLIGRPEDRIKKYLKKSRN